ncbi:hypothetical protein ACEWY4_001536 [Coilia grayii]|uniref:Gypsy retrotransposon integrase-like protein 1 n=1 Tax=Coilia grayii TaxID=363190 RepID=A0ABD1KTB5_9TELE
MDSVSAFVTSPSEEAFDCLTKDQLRKIADHYQLEVDLPKTLRKQELRGAVKSKLLELGVISVDPLKVVPPRGPLLPQGAAPVSLPAACLTFEQQKQLLELQMERDRLAAGEREKDRQLEYDRLRRDNERFKLLSEGRISAGVGGFDVLPPGRGANEFSLSTMIKFLPKFNDRDPDTFFSLFENIADDRGWVDSERILLLQSVLTGRAQDAFVALSVAERRKYTSVKEAILKAHELVPEAYRQKFRNWRKGDRQTHTELVRELTVFFNRWCTAEGVSTFRGLCDLVLLEQFKNIIPDHLATYVNERKVKTAAEAAVLADEFVLTHKTNFRGDASTPINSRGESRFSRFKESVYRGGEDRCRYCNERGHWKRECPVLHGKGRGRPAPAKSVCAASSGGSTPVRGASGVASVCRASARLSGGESPGISAEEPTLGLERGHSETYEPFITNGFVSLVGSLQKVPVKVLRDTGASESFVRQTILPFSIQSETGSCVLIRGIGMQTFSVPLHTFNLESDLISGEVVMAVRPQLPVEGVDVILGNNLAGGRVWANLSPPPVVNTVPLPVVSECAEQYPDVFCACAVTRAMTRVRDVSNTVPSLPVLPSTLSRCDLIAAQQGDDELVSILSDALSVDDMKSTSSGYFILDGVLVRKWTAFSNESVLQIVVPAKYRALVLQTAHGDVAGHFGVRKTYQRLMQHFYWPRLKRSVADFVRTCHVCQLTGKPNQSIKPAPLHPIPAVGQPFEHLIVDCLASKNLSKAQKKMKRLYDRRAEERTFHPGDQLLALLPVPGSPFCAKFFGPYVVVRQVTDVDYLMCTPDRKRSTQLCHMNLLKPYYAPPRDEGAKSVGLAAVSRVIGDVQEVAAPDVVSPGDPVLQPWLKNPLLSCCT